MGLRSCERESRDYWIGLVGFGSSKTLVLYMPVCLMSTSFAVALFSGCLGFVLVAYYFLLSN